jgi:hypothetical protein
LGADLREFRLNLSELPSDRQDVAGVDEDLLNAPSPPVVG